MSRKVLLFGILIAFGGVLAAVLVVYAVGTPQPLSVTPVSSCALQVSWTQPAPPGTRYDAKRDNLIQTGVTVVNPTGNSYYFVDRNQYSWPVLDPGTSHTYYVQAYDAVAGEASGYQGPVSGTTNALPSTPGSPQNLVATSTGGNIELSWATSSVSFLFNTYGKFIVERATSTDGSTWSSWGELDKIPRYPLYYSDPISNQGQFYKYRITAEEVGGEGCNPNRPQHRVDSAPSAEVIIPSTPVITNASFSNGPPRQINLTWTYDSAAASNINRFELWRSLGITFDPLTAVEIASSIAPADRTYRDTSVDQTNPQSYSYELRACTVTACSFFSAERGASTAVLAPANLGAGIATAGISFGDVYLTWSGDILAGSRYFVERASSTRVFAPIATLTDVYVAEHNNTYYNNNLRLHDTYYYRMRVQAADGTLSDWSNEASVNLDVLYAVRGVAWAGVTYLPPVRSNGAPSGNLPSGTNSVTLSLTTDIPATCKYSATAGTAYDDMTATFATTGGTSHSQVVNGLTYGASYSYYVRCASSGAVNSDDYTISFAIGSAPVITDYAPTSQLPPDTTETTLSVTTNVAATCRYSTTAGVPYSSMTNTFASDISSSQTVHSQTISGLQNGDEVHYYVRCNAGGNINTSDFLAPDGIVISVAVPVVPFAPSELTNVSLSFSEVGLSWADNSDNEGRFEVYRYKTIVPNEAEAEQVFDNIYTSGPNAYYYFDRTVEPDTTYWYKVRACNSAGCSDNTPKLIVSTPADTGGGSISSCFANDDCPVGETCDTSTVECSGGAGPCQRAGSCKTKTEDTQ